MKKFEWKKVLTNKEKAQVLALKERSEKLQPIHYKLDLGFTEGEKWYATHMLYWVGEELVGYGWALSFDSSELEATLISPKMAEHLPAILTEIQRYGKEQSVKSIVLIADSSDTVLAEAFKERKIKKQFSEYYMLLDMKKAKSNEQTGIKLVSPEQTDLEVLEQLLGGRPIEEDLANTFVYKEDKELLACIRLEETQKEWGIFGFVVDQSQRGKGLGRKVMDAAIQQMFASDPKSIYLEVETDNVPAYPLYLSTGFVVRNQYDYYELIK
ncbi:GNAT family N-acetyltransferase [Candidatus Enterococcus clewellii]|uniref:GNAT family N-acetyltransferase n=1 Tax=Candidatus Enterococcus clewellii TaxID=1834193 RepID=UPI0014837BB9|nr:GNAT family N-acetyltransferase [Enterococcus sp. 9E7_DIV0242]